MLHHSRDSGLSKGPTTGAGIHSVSAWRRDPTLTLLQVERGLYPWKPACELSQWAWSVGDQRIHFKTVTEWLLVEARQLYPIPRCFLAQRIFSCQSKCLLSIFQFSEYRLKWDTFSWQHLTNALNNFDFLAPVQGESKSCNYTKCITMEWNAYEFLTLWNTTMLFLLFSETNRRNTLTHQQPE